MHLYDPNPTHECELSFLSWMRIRFAFSYSKNEEKKGVGWD